jgi:CubicO group peptidase (beta-lactamase class C family)
VRAACAAALAASSILTLAGQERSAPPEPGAARAAAQAPDTPAGRQLVRWLAVFNTGDRAARQQFYREQWAYSPNQDYYEDLHDQSGGFEVLRVEQSTPERIVALARQVDSDQVVRLAFQVEAETPHRVAAFTTQPAPRPPDLAIARLSEAELLNALRADLDRRAAADRFSGTVLVARNGTPIFTGAYGQADRERKVPNRLDTRMKNGSMNKMFTAVATLTLVQAGKLALDDPLGRHLPDYPNRDVASKVTIHHLLTHTGGTGDIFGPQFAARRAELKSHQDYIALYGTRGPLFEPGSQYAYSNYGFALLGAVIEKVSGRNYYDYVRDHVYAPANMTSTGSEPEDQVLPNTAVGYMRRARAWERNAGTLPARGMAAGGGYTTVEDLLRFATALTSHRLLTADTTRLLTTAKGVPGGGGYAYGFVDTRVNGVRAIGHSGGAPGQSGDLLILPGSGYVIAVLANIDPPAAPRISNYIASRLPAMAQAAAEAAAGPRSLRGLVMESIERPSPN